MKARLAYLAPGLLLVGFHGLLWALGTEASHLSTIILAIGVTVLMNFLFNAYRREEWLREENEHSLQREVEFYVYARKIFNAQTAAIARLQALLHRRSPR